jgi:hypothetical protein
MFEIPGFNEKIPAVVLPLRSTRADNAWLGERFTVRLVADLPALRVHSRGGIAATHQEQFSRSGTVGSWFAIGDVILTREEYLAVHALPGNFTHQDEWLLPSGSILNVGICSPLFGHKGGALQAEWLEGPPLQNRPLKGWWSSKIGNA